MAPLSLLRPVWAAYGGNNGRRPAVPASSGIRSTQAGTAYITATCGSAQPATTTVIFTPDVPYSVTLQAKPVTPTVGTNSVLTATVFDQYHNMVSGVVTITFDSSPDSSHVTPPVVTTTNGVATSLISDTLAGAKFITATSQPAALAGTATVTFTPGTPTTITVQLDSINLVAKSNTTTTVTAQVIDIYNNPVPGVMLTGTLPYTLGTVTGPGRTGANGQAFGVWTAGPTTTVGYGPLNVTNGAITGTATATLVFTTPQTVTVQVAQPVLFARSNMTSVITVTVTDHLGNPIAGAALSPTLATELGTVAPFSQTNANGQSFSTWTASLASDPGSGLLRITATSSVSGTAPVTLTADVPYTMTLQANPASLVVGQSSGLLANIIKDRFGNLVSNGTVVTFTSSLGNVSPLTDTTTGGSAVSSINSTQAGVANITATSGLAQGLATVTFEPDVPSALDLQANPISLVVGNSSTLTATVTDRFGNRVANGAPVTFTTDLGSVISSTSTMTGTATSSISSTQAGTAHITATSGAAWNTMAVTFTPGAPLTLTLQATPTLQVVGNNSVLTATVRDRYSNLVSNGILVTFTADRGSVVSPGSTVNGIATSYISATQVCTAHVTAMLGAITNTATVIFVPDVPFSMTLQARPISQTAGLSSVLTATVYDRFSNLVANNTTVTFTKDLTGSIVSPVRDDERHCHIAGHDNIREPGAHYGHEWSGLENDDDHLYTRRTRHDDGAARHGHIDCQ